MKKIRSPRIKKEDRGKSPSGILLLEKIKALRKQKGLSQKEMGEKIGLKIFTYAKIENGENPLSIERFLDILKVLEVCSYNQVLPGINNEVADEFEKVLISGSYTFDQIRLKTIYVQKLIDQLEERLKKNTPAGIGEIITDIELIQFLLSQIGSLSTNGDLSFDTLKKLIDKID